MCVCFIVHLYRGIRHVEQRSIAYRICGKKKYFPCDVAFSDGHHQFSVHRVRTAIKKTKKIFHANSSRSRSFGSSNPDPHQNSNPPLRHPPSIGYWCYALSNLILILIREKQKTKFKQVSLKRSDSFVRSFCLFGFCFAHVAIAAAATTTNLNHL